MFEEPNADWIEKKKGHCAAIRNRETDRSVIDAFQFSKLATIEPDMVYDIFNKTLAAVDYRVDVAVFVVKSHGEYNPMAEYINTVMSSVLQNRVRNVVVVCEKCQDFYVFGEQSLERRPLSELNENVRACGKHPDLDHGLQVTNNYARFFEWMSSKTPVFQILILEVSKKTKNSIS